MEEDIIDLLFNKKDEECIFNLSDNFLEDLNNRLEISNDKIEHLINKKVNPKLRTHLKMFIRDSDNLKNKYHHRENQLYYKNGFVDGISAILMLASFK